MDDRLRRRVVMATHPTSSDGSSLWFCEILCGLCPGEGAGGVYGECSGEGVSGGGPVVLGRVVSWCTAECGLRLVAWSGDGLCPVPECGWSQMKQSSASVTGPSLECEVILVWGGVGGGAVRGRVLCGCHSGGGAAPATIVEDDDEGDDSAGVWCVSSGALIDEAESLSCEVTRKIREPENMRGL